MDKDIKELISKNEIMCKISELANRIHNEHEKDINCIVVLNGAMIFFVDLMRELKKLGHDINIIPIKISSYVDDKSTGTINLELDIHQDLKDKDVIIVEDIIESGKSMKYLKAHLKEKGVGEIKLCSLLDKKMNREVDCDIDYLGFSIEDKFVIGYGLDYNQKYRDLDFIGYIE